MGTVAVPRRFCQQMLQTLVSSSLGFAAAEDLGYVLTTGRGPGCYGENQSPPPLPSLLQGATQNREGAFEGSSASAGPTLSK